MALRSSRCTFSISATSAVTLVRDNGADERVVTGLPSIAGATEALGPSDISFTGNQKYVVSIGLGGSPALKAAYGPQAAWLGTLLTGKLKQAEQVGHMAP